MHKIDLKGDETNLKTVQKINPHPCDSGEKFRQLKMLEGRESSAFWAQGFTSEENFHS